MVNTDTVKLQLVQQIINLPETLLPQVRDFIATLSDDEQELAINGAQHQQGQSQSRDQAPELPWEQDPLLKLIGLVDDGSLPSTSAEIDELLYGKNPL